MCKSLLREIDTSARPSMCGVTRAFTLLFEELMVSQKTATLFASSSLSCAHKKSPRPFDLGLFHLYLVHPASFELEGFMPGLYGLYRALIG
jgi:hypothetical protein